ncbi:MAG: hypothetical protein H6558_05690 [Lewinellaceae bacterium]|nr:hypothetical protein [Lewinellaceae bacterium]MCB9286155.1 hypothetical protein [Lewinellaceae bacterium]
MLQKSKYNENKSRPETLKNCQSTDGLAILAAGRAEKSRPATKNDIWQLLLPMAQSQQQTAKS